MPRLRFQGINYDPDEELKGKLIAWPTLLSASATIATYIQELRTLHLEARVKTRIVTSQLAFERRAWRDGLLFDLRGWVGPLLDEKDVGLSESVTVSSYFDVKYDKPIKHVVVVDAEHPRGLKVPIHYRSEKDTEQALKDRWEGSEVAVFKALKKKTLPRIVEVPVLVEAQVYFAARPAIAIPGPPNTNNASVLFNRDFLALSSSALEQGRMKWIFRPLRDGITIVRVSAYDHTTNEERVSTLRYLLDSGGEKQGAVMQLDKPFPVVSWNEWIAHGLGAIEVVSIMHEIQLRPLPSNTSGFVSHPYELGNVRLIETDGEGPGTKTISINSTGWSSFGPPYTVDGDWPGNKTFDFPGDVKVDLLSSFKLLSEHLANSQGNKIAIRKIVLRQPNHARIDQPLWIYYLRHDSIIGVGANTGVSWNFGTGNLDLAHVNELTELLDYEKVWEPDGPGSTIREGKGEGEGHREFSQTYKTIHTTVTPLREKIPQKLFEMLISPGAAAENANGNEQGTLELDEEQETEGKPELQRVFIDQSGPFAVNEDKGPEAEPELVPSVEKKVTKAPLKRKRNKKKQKPSGKAKSTVLETRKNKRRRTKINWSAKKKAQEGIVKQDEAQA